MALVRKRSRNLRGVRFLLVLVPGLVTLFFMVWKYLREDSFYDDRLFLSLSTLTTNVTVSPNGNSDFRPVQCDRAADDVPVDPNNGAMHSKQTKTHPSFRISIHNKVYDSVRWNCIMDYGLYYERGVTEHARAILKQENNQGSLMIDVGMNIGWFALYAAAMGHPVVAFEPNPANRLRMCESIALNDFSGVSIFPYAVGNEWNKTVTLKFKSGAPGSASALLENDQSKDLISLPTKMVTLDFVAEKLGWFSNQEPIALLKIDVEGFDYEVLVGAKTLLRSQLVKNVFIELPFLRQVGVIRGMFQILVDSGYTLHVFGGWNGFQLENAPTFQAGAAADAYVAHAYAKNSTSGSFNLWWRLEKS